MPPHSVVERMWGMIYTLKSHRHINYYYNEKPRESVGLSFKYGKQGLMCGAVISKCLARSLWGEPHPSPMPCLWPKSQEPLWVLRGVAWLP